MNNFWNKTNTILGVIAIIVAILVGWYFNRQKSTSINIEEVNATLLSQELDIDGLSVRYLYHDSIEVDNLWKTLFTLKNTGENSLYGNGFSEINIHDGVIPLKFTQCGKVLNIKITNDNSGSILGKDGRLTITQWKPNEYIEIEVLSEGKMAPKLIINERGIKDGVVTYTKYTPSNKTISPRLIDSFPLVFQSASKWISIVIIAIVVLAIIVQIPAQVKGKSQAAKISTAILWCLLAITILCPLLWMF